ncbi:serine/threonine-protein kinase [Agrococcus sp. KRD186]|uniref:serine/threonine-protein kinase n=1 Tax=Agrococcus sp. KRD186 TaxID=2729730 RepID=UPI0019D18E82|nr:serine/threonine-protein kinase [Agrococcus sp. KRD186]
MSPKRAASPPPSIPGYDFDRLLGSGGFADVFLYQQLLPTRPVAVKVLLPDLVDRDLIEDFRHEANIMAQLSSHPSIVTIFGAAVSEDGRPYLAMEYCPRPNLGSRYRRDRFAVPEVLQLGVQISGALETAHRAGVLHRDIKPANILVTAYNRPALTDFGIAASDSRAGGEGMSIPWSPPEAFDSPPRAGRESDVFSLAATLATLLAGRTPFEMPGLGNTAIDLIGRIQRGQAAPIARADVPQTLETVLQQAMHPDPRRRHATALEFGRALQQVEAELHLPPTQMDVLDENLPPDEVEEDDGGATRIRGVVHIDPHEGDADAGRTELRPGGPRPVPMLGAAPEPAAPSERQPEPVVRSRRTRWGGIAAAISIAIVLGTVLTISLLSLGADPRSEPQTGPTDGPAQAAPPPQAPILVEQRIESGEAVFVLGNPQPQEGDRLRYRVDSSAANAQTERSDDLTIRVPVDPDGRTCIQVAVERASGASSALVEQCIDG